MAALLRAATRAAGTPPTSSPSSRAAPAAVLLGPPGRRRRPLLRGAGSPAGRRPAVLWHPGPRLRPRRGASPRRSRRWPRSTSRRSAASNPEGPYFLGGWSLGGPVAFEMARQLRALGESYRPARRPRRRPRLENPAAERERCRLPARHRGLCRQFLGPEAGHLPRAPCGPRPRGANRLRSRVLGRRRLPAAGDRREAAAPRARESTAATSRALRLYRRGLLRRMA